MEKIIQPLEFPRPPINRGRGGSWVVCSITALLFLSLFLASCKHTPDTLAEKPEMTGTTQVFEADEKVILKAISRVLKERGWGEAHGEADKGRLETDYVIQEDFRTKVVATVKKISRREREVTLLVITETKSSSEWKPKNIMGKEQYDRIFGEIEMAIYHEWYKAE